jgi:hypothetical protein
MKMPPVSGDDARDTALLLAYGANPDAEVLPDREDYGKLPPGRDRKDPVEDAILDELAWRVALATWEQTKSRSEGGLLLPDEVDNLQRLIEMAWAFWVASGRPSAELPVRPPLASPIHPVQKLFVERCEIISRRAVGGQELCPEIEELRRRQ